MRNTICLLLLAITLVGCATAPQSTVRKIAADATEGEFTLAGGSERGTNGWFDGRVDMALCCHIRHF